MAMLNFNAGEHEAQSFDLIPAGWYEAVVVKSELVQIKSGRGTMLKLQLKLQGNEKYNGRVVFDQMNINYPDNPVVQDIAERQLAALCHAVHVLNLTDTEQLHGIPVSIKVGIRVSSEDDKKRGYDDQNVIKGYKTIDGAVAAPSAPVAAPTVPPVAPKPATPAAAPVAAAAPRRGRPPKAATPPVAPVEEAPVPSAPVAAPEEQPIPAPAEPAADVAAGSEDDIPDWMKMV